MATGALLLIKLNTEKFTSTAVLALVLNFLETRRLVTGTTGPCCAGDEPSRRQEIQNQCEDRGGREFLGVQLDQQQRPGGHFLSQRDIRPGHRHPCTSSGAYRAAIQLLVRRTHRGPERMIGPAPDPARSNPRLARTICPRLLTGECGT